MKSNCDQDSQLSKQIVRWYIKKGRNNLPWRKNVTAYRVWISEIMLQQTQVKTVIPFFNKFISRYPNLKSLSLANEEEILALWTGLGFYRRAINIYKAKEIILSDFKNRFPKSFDDIVRLPGIGESTAGAIMSIAYQIPHPILDANVKRVISRYESVDNDSTHKSNKKLWALSHKHTPKKIFFHTHKE
jgi:A/G-specific adenine glycosylase